MEAYGHTWKFADSDEGTSFLADGKQVFTTARCVTGAIVPFKDGAVFSVLEPQRGGDVACDKTYLYEYRASSSTVRELLKDEGLQRSIHAYNPRTHSLLLVESPCYYEFKKYEKDIPRWLRVFSISDGRSRTIDQLEADSGVLATWDDQGKNLYICAWLGEKGSSIYRWEEDSGLLTQLLPRNSSVSEFRPLKEGQMVFMGVFSVGPNDDEATLFHQGPILVSNVSYNREADVLEYDYMLSGHLEGHFRSKIAELSEEGRKALADDRKLRLEKSSPPPSLEYHETIRVGEHELQLSVAEKGSSSVSIASNEDKGASRQILSLKHPVRAAAPNARLDLVVLFTEPAEDPNRDRSAGGETTLREIWLADLATGQGHLIGHCDNITEPEFVWHENEERLYVKDHTLQTWKRGEDSLKPVLNGEIHVPTFLPLTNGGLALYLSNGRDPNGRVTPGIYHLAPGSREPVLLKAYESAMSFEQDPSDPNLVTYELPSPPGEPKVGHVRIPEAGR